MEKRESSCTVDRNVNWYSHCREEYGDSFKKIKNRNTIWPSKLTTVYMSWENHNSKIYVLQCSLQNYLQHPGHRSSINVHHEWIKMWYIYTMEYYWAIKRNEIGSFVETWMELETTIQNQVNQKDKYCILTHIYEI